ncbi:winged helix-turn-helix transcriptional regulator [Patescibacteria group bacterium]|nr:winged helix-turn-helix transcriptional regulator [Patescibacteria group bacterium]
MPDDSPVSDSSSSAPVSEPIPIPAGVQTAQPEPLTAQIPANGPFDSAQDKSTPAPEPMPQTAPPPPVSIITPIVNLARDLALRARVVIQNRKRVKLDKILTEITKKGSITNNQVEKLLRVSDATATRYLSQLEKEGKIVQVGKTGKSVKYQKI